MPRKNTKVTPLISLCDGSYVIAPAALKFLSVSTVQAIVGDLANFSNSETANKRRPMRIRGKQTKMPFDGDGGPTNKNEDE
jgi:hypothetical protein